MKKTLRLIIEGGKATPGPPLGPTLSPYKLNIMEVVKAINDATKEYDGLPVPIEITIDTDTKKFEVKVGIPTTTALLLKEVGSKNPPKGASEKIGNLSLEQAIKIALMKKEQLQAKTLKAAVKTILGSARSIGITIDGKDPKVVKDEIDRGVHDELFSKYESEWRGG